MCVPKQTTVASNNSKKTWEKDGGVNLIMVYCNNFCKCHNAPQYNNNNNNNMMMMMMMTKET
jgi:hypothetical protein